MRRPPAAQNRFGERKVLRERELEVLAASWNQQWREADRLDGTGLVRHCITGALQRIEQHADAKHLRRLSKPFVGAGCRAGDAPVGRSDLERVRQAMRQQAADGIVLASSDQGFDLRWCHQTARRVMNQHPIVRPGPSLAQCPQAIANRRRARSAADSQQVFTCRWEARKNDPHLSVFRRHRQRDALEQTLQRPEDLQRVLHHRAASDALILLRPLSTGANSGPRARDQDEKSGS